MKLEIRVTHDNTFRGKEYWSAVEENVYDVDCDQDGYHVTAGMGTGHSPREAIDALLDSLDLRAMAEGRQ